MKIGFVFDDSLDRPDGVQQAVIALGEWLKKQGHEVRYLVANTTRRDLTGIRSFGRTLRIDFNGNQMGTSLPVSKAKLRTYLEHELFDVLHVQMPYSPFFAGRVIKCAPQKTRIVGTFHVLPINVLATFGTRLLGIFQRRTLRRFFTIAAVSDSAKQFAEQTLKFRCEVIHNPIDLQKFRTRALPKNGRKRVVFLGRLVERKGVVELCRAWETLLNKYPELVDDCELVIAGKGELADEMAAWRKRQPDDWHITLPGFIEESKKAALLASADVAVFPSLGGESFGIILVEAMAAGASVVLGGDNPGYRTVLGDRPEQLIDVTDRQAFADQLHDFLTSHSARLDAAEWQQSAMQQYDVRIVGARWLARYAASGR